MDRYAPQVPAPRCSLPQSRNIAGRPVWEPPVLDYEHLIGEEYEHKRKAILKYYRNDVAMTTDWLDTDTEYNLLLMYLRSML